MIPERSPDLIGTRVRHVGARDGSIDLRTVDLEKEVPDVNILFDRDGNLVEDIDSNVLEFNPVVPIGGSKRASREAAVQFKNKRRDEIIEQIGAAGIQRGGGGGAAHMI